MNGKEWTENRRKTKELRIKQILMFSTQFEILLMKASANESAIGVFAIQTPQHFMYFG